MRAEILATMLLVAGCEWQGKPAVIRCEAVSTAPSGPKDRQEKLNELADTNADIDLAIARDDWMAIKVAQTTEEGAHKRYDQAATDQAKNVGQLLMELTRSSDQLDKVLDRAARHRCNR